MKIAMLAWESMHSVAVGGVAAHVTELAAALHRNGHKVCVFTRRGPGHPITAGLKPLIITGAPTSRMGTLSKKSTTCAGPSWIMSSK